MINIEDFVNKEVDFYFEGKNLHFKLSQSLFSSFEIDKGSKLLLKTITKSLNISNINTLLDIGSGIGVLGITLKSLNSNIEVFSQDRDALAVEFTKLNARENGIKGLHAFGSLALYPPLLKNFPSLTAPITKILPKLFDLIVCNLPAKAGESVLRAIIKNAPIYNTLNGSCAFVIVKPLKELFRSEIDKNNFKIISEFSTNKHSVFIYQKNADSKKTNRLNFHQPLEDLLKPYFRGNLQIDNNLKLDTVYGIKNFDSIDFETELALSFLKGKSFKGNILIWKPHQGYIPAHICLDPKNKPTNIVIASRDYLSLLITKYNIQKVTHYQFSTHYIHYPFFDYNLYTSNNFEYTIISLDHDPGIDYTKEILQITNNPTSHGKSLIVTGTSRQITSIKKLIKRKKILKIKKSHGYSGIFIWFT